MPPLGGYSKMEASMKISSVKFILIIVSLFLVTGCTSGQVANSSPNEEFSVKVTIALVSAFLSFLGSFGVYQIKQRKEPRKQLSYDLKITKGLVSVQESVKDKVTILYDGQNTANIFLVSCDLVNDGNTVIKNQYVRFEFTKEAEVIDFYFDPKPEKEFGVKESQEDNLETYEKRFRISHLEKNQQIGFNFVLTGQKDVNVKLHPFNEEGNVKFIPSSISKVEDDKLLVYKFIAYSLMYLLFPPVFNLVSSSVTNIAVNLTRIAILFALFPTIKPFAKLMANVLIRLSYDKSIETEISIRDSQISRLDIKSESIEKEEATYR